MKTTRSVPKIEVSLEPTPLLPVAAMPLPSEGTGKSRAHDRCGGSRPARAGGRGADSEWPELPQRTNEPFEPRPSEAPAWVEPPFLPHPPPPPSPGMPPEFAPRPD